MYKRPNNEALDYSRVRSIVEYFERVEGINFGRVVRNSPYILAAEKDVFENFDENRMFLTKHLELEEKDLGRILSSNAYILSRSLDATVKPCIEYLESNGFSKEHLRSFVIRFPRCLLLSQDKLRMSESTITGLGLTGEEYSRILRKFPPIVGLSPSKIQSIKNWLGEFGITTPQELRSVILKFPQILSQNSNGKLSTIVKYMTDDLHLPNEVIKTALLSSPDVFGRNLDRIKSHVESMMVIGMTTEELRRLVSSYPGALRFNLAAEPYRSKIRFLKETLNQNPSSTLPVHPKYLSYSMDRISSRAAFLMEKNKKTSGVTAWCSPTDEIFANRFCKVSLSEWESFKERYLSGSN